MTAKIIPFAGARTARQPKAAPAKKVSRAASQPKPRTPSPAAPYAGLNTPCAPWVPKCVVNADGSVSCVNWQDRPAAQIARQIAIAARLIASPR